LPVAALRRDVPVLNVGKERRFDPSSLRLPNGLGSLGLRTDYGVELLADLNGDRAGPPGPHLAHVAQLIASSLADVAHRISLSVGLQS